MDLGQSPDTERAFLLKIQEQWIEQHPVYRKVLTARNVAETKLATVAWNDDPATYVATVRAARDALRLAEHDLGQLRSNLTERFQGRIG